MTQTGHKNKRYEVVEGQIKVVQDDLRSEDNVRWQNHLFCNENHVFILLGAK